MVSLSRASIGRLPRNLPPPNPTTRPGVRVSRGVSEESLHLRDFTTDVKSALKYAA